MSIAGEFVVVPTEVLHQHLAGQQDLCAWVRGELPGQPQPLVLDIGDHWHGINALCDALDIAYVMGEHDIALACCESAFWVPEARVPLMAHQLQDISAEDLQSALEALDYDNLYHGHYLQEHPQQLADTLGQIAALYEKAGQSGQVVLFMIC
ncbi:MULTISPECIES: DUF1877 family protein [Giesbergeria]|uniref:DUF1877 family protein n=1 Tax=Giesbergeria sinuosa TaxID=80883 RepID=A0ABV9Q9B2_9BURK